MRVGLEFKVSTDDGFGMSLAHFQIHLQAVRIAIQRQLEKKHPGISVKDAHLRLYAKDNRIRFVYDPNQHVRFDLLDLLDLDEEEDNA